MNQSFVIIIYMAVVLGLFYMMIFLPERRRKKKFSELMQNIKVNEEVVTTGGIMGKIVNIQNDFVIIQSGPDMARIKILKTAITSVVNKNLEQNK